MGMGFWQSLRRIALKSDKIKGIWGFCWTIPVSGPFPRFSGRNPGTTGAQKPGQSYSRSHKTSAARLPGIGCPGVGCPVFVRFRHYFRIFLLLNYFWSSKNKLFIKLENIFNIVSTVKQLTIKNLHHSLSQYLIINKSL